MENKFFSKQWFAGVWNSLKKDWADTSFGAFLIKKRLIPIFVIFFLWVAYILRETIFSFFRETFPFLANNAWILLLGALSVIALVRLLVYWRWSSPKTERQWKLLIISLIAVLWGDILYRPHWNLASSQEAAIRNEERKRTDSILETWKRDDTRAFKIEEKKKKDYEKELLRVRQSFDSTVGVSASKDQKISSLNGVLASVKSANHFLDSLNNVKKDPVVVVKETIVPEPSAPPSVKKEPRKDVAKSPPKKRQNDWVKVSYKKPPGAFKN